MTVPSPVERGRQEPGEVPDDVADLHRRAARWFLDHDLPDPAFHHAVAGHDPELAIPILERYESEKLHGGELRVVQRWLDAIPAEWDAAYPQLGLVRAGVLAAEHVAAQHELVDLAEALVIEAAVLRDGARDVGAVARHLSAKVEQQEFAGLHPPR